MPTTLPRWYHAASTRPLDGTYAMCIKHFALLVAFGAMPALAHVAAPGVDYTAYKDSNGARCCDDRDCQAADDFIETTEHGQAVIRLLIGGRWIAVPRAFVVADDAPDGRAHWCGGRLFTNSHLGWMPFPWCVILPPRAT
jgi:hypothetical protein